MYSNSIHTDAMSLWFAQRKYGRDNYNSIVKFIKLANRVSSIHTDPFSSFFFSLI